MGFTRPAMRWMTPLIALLPLACNEIQARTATAPPCKSNSARPDRGTQIAVTGDSLITMRLSVHADPQFLRMIDLIRCSDAAFTNLEMLFHDYEPYPASESGGTYMRADPSMVEELVWAGFDMVARANNHSNDYGVEGMRLTTEYVARAGLVQAGVGESLRQAREARYLETEKGRVALVSVASTFPDQGRAGESWGDTRARPGLSPLRFTSSYVLRRPQFEALYEGLRIARQIEGLQRASTPLSEFSALGRHFEMGERQEIRTAPLPEDLDAINAVVSNASRQARYTIVSSHTHEDGADRFTPPEFFVTFAHAVIDSGADMVVVSGPHLLRGIEIYKGKPIFYSLGNFIFENETLLRQPPENYQPLGLRPGAGVADFNDRRAVEGADKFAADEYIWESVIAIPRFIDKALIDIRIYPISLGFGKPRDLRGWPVLASPQVAKKILDDLSRLSRPLGTHIESKDGVGVIKIGSALNPLGTRPNQPR